jgi:hypothetical protein
MMAAAEAVVEVAERIPTIAVESLAEIVSQMRIHFQIHYIVELVIQVASSNKQKRLPKSNLFTYVYIFL